jgi:dipeptidyl aminopeptidase/acylaminoacyl peptidase
VLSAELTPDRTKWVLHTSEVSLFERHMALLPVAGGPPERLTAGVGGHQAVLSPDGRWLADVFSTANRPGELFLKAAKISAPMAAMTKSPTDEWLAFPWLKPDIVMVAASDGAEVPARIYRPEQLGAKANGAAVIFVHGAGYLHNVHNYWSSYFREYMFHHLLAQQGYVVLDLDYRASAGYGRDWRTAIYRHMGGRDLQDHVDGARYLNRRFGVEFERIGIYGGSYGGFITLMALFTEPKSFGAGAGLRSVTDWAHYNHGYTAAILNEPQDDSTAYRRSSPIYFAEGLEDPLLMAHGMVDVNVHFQDIVRLSQRLIELGKTNWELAVYPVEDHGFVRPDSWTDEYRRILELFERTLPRR